VQKNDHKYTWPELYKVDNSHISKQKINSLNRSKGWDYGYNKEFNVVVISKTGQVGEIYDINGVKIALPKKPKTIPKRENKWVATEMDKKLSKIQTVHQWRARPDSFKADHIDYITQEFDRREDGYWFINNDVPTYITGSNYMYLQHTKIDVGHPDFREANRVFYIYWEACVADKRSYGMIYLKIRRSGFSFMGASETVNAATLAKDSRVGMLSKTGPDAKKLFTDKVVPINLNYPFFFKPMQSGMDRPKTEISYSIPAARITKNNMYDVHEEDEDEGLDTSIDWKNTDDNSYDGEKLLRLLHDESSKWVKPLDIKKNWRVTKTCLRLGSRIIGKCMMGSTCNALAKGGQNYKDLYEDSNPNDRSKNGQTKSGLYSLFIPMEWNFEGYIDEFGFPVFTTPKKPIMGVDGELIDTGVIDYWNNEVEARENDPDDLNEFYRQFPRTESHAFRDESKASIFNLTKIYEQIDHNDGTIHGRTLTRGYFSWKNGEKDTEVIWTPDPRGRFLTSWIPPKQYRNSKRISKGNMFPGNEHLGMFGCDSYDISGTVDGRGSNGALHGLTKFNMHEEIPSNLFFLQYVARPKTAEIFFEDVLMAIVFYGMPILAENNKPRLLYHLKNRGYRGYSMNRPDKHISKLSKTERELGGIPNTSEDVKQVHADSIATYIEEYVGYDKEGTYREADECGNMLFNETLQDWAKFDISNRTKFDASISSGLAIMGTRKHKLTPDRKRSEIKFNFVTYNNSGNRSKIS
jgi:hypothetical protein